MEVVLEVHVELQSTGGDGGDGAPNSITNTPTTYAGGGGGGYLDPAGTSMVELVVEVMVKIVAPWSIWIS